MIYIYTKQEKREIERVPAVFAAYLNQRNYSSFSPAAPHSHERFAAPPLSA